MTAVLWIVWCAACLPGPSEAAGVEWPLRAGDVFTEGPAGRTLDYGDLDFCRVPGERSRSGAARRREIADMVFASRPARTAYVLEPLRNESGRLVCRMRCSEACERRFASAVRDGARVSFELEGILGMDGTGARPRRGMPLGLAIPEHGLRLNNHLLLEVFYEEVPTDGTTGVGETSGARREERPASSDAAPGGLDDLLDRIEELARRWTMPPEDGHAGMRFSEDSPATRVPLPRAHDDDDAWGAEEGTWDATRVDVRVLGFVTRAIASTGISAAPLSTRSHHRARGVNGTASTRVRDIEWRITVRWVRVDATATTPGGGGADETAAGFYAALNDFREGDRKAEWVWRRTTQAGALLAGFSLLACLILHRWASAGARWVSASVKRHQNERLFEDDPSFRIVRGSGPPRAAASASPSGPSQDPYRAEGPRHRAAVASDRAGSEAMVAVGSNGEGVFLEFPSFQEGERHVEAFRDEELVSSVSSVDGDDEGRPGSAERVMDEREYLWWRVICDRLSYETPSLGNALGCHLGVGTQALVVCPAVAIGGLAFGEAVEGPWVLLVVAAAAVASGYALGFYWRLLDVSREWPSTGSLLARCLASALPGACLLALFLGGGGGRDAWDRDLAGFLLAWGFFALVVGFFCLLGYLLHREIPGGRGFRRSKPTLLGEFKGCDVATACLGGCESARGKGRASLRDVASCEGLAMGLCVLAAVFVVAAPAVPCLHRVLVVRDLARSYAVDRSLAVDDAASAALMLFVSALCAFPCAGGLTFLALRMRRSDWFWRPFVVGALGALVLCGYATLYHLLFHRAATRDAWIDLAGYLLPGAVFYACAVGTAGFWGAYRVVWLTARRKRSD